MRLESLSVFLSVAKHRSFSEAARYEHMTQPAVTSCIKNLEAHFGTVLFQRVSGQKRPLELTPEGAIVEKYASEILHLHSLMEHDIHSLAQEEKEFSIGSGKSNAIFVLPRLLQAFSEKHRDARYIIRNYTNSGSIVQQLMDRQLDLGITIFRPAEEVLEAYRFLSNPYTLAFPVDTRVPDTISAEELCRYPMIIRESTCDSYQKVKQGLEAIGVSMSDLRTVMTVYDNAALYYAIRNGVGCGFIPRTLLLDNSVASPIVKPVRVRRFKAYQHLHLVRRKDSPMTPDMQLLWNFVQGGSWMGSTAAFPPELP
ncbi:MAG: LysR family transcriptional regulator [Clostridium sp.]|nr:LysR family transcriptional regulator [Clostridium sp.]